MTENEAQDVSKTESCDTSFTRKIGQKLVKNECKERRLQLLGIVKKIGIRNATDDMKIWANHYKVKERTIYRDFKWIRANYKPLEIEEIKIDLEVERDQSLKQALRVLSTSTNHEEKLKAISTLMQAGKHVREELEAWGEKPKVADPIEISEREESPKKEIEGFKAILNKLTEEEQKKLKAALNYLRGENA